jgi:hypothetical protein
MHYASIPSLTFSMTRTIVTTTEFQSIAKVQTRHMLSRTSYVLRTLECILRNRQNSQLEGSSETIQDIHLTELISGSAFVGRPLHPSSLTA